MTKILTGKWYDHFTKYPELISELDMIIAILDKEADFYPKKNQVFRIFKELSPEEVKLVLLGQDPFHNLYKNIPSACGRAFATENGYLNPSLRNLLKELKEDVGVELKDYSLQEWVDKGVFLLNTALTVKSGKPESHLELWKPFMEKLIPTIKGKSWLLLGKKAQEWEKYINGEVIKAPHPSPLSRGFIGSKIYSKTNHIINWQ